MEKWFHRKIRVSVRKRNIVWGGSRTICHAFLLSKRDNKKDRWIMPRTTNKLISQVTFLCMCKWSNRLGAKWSHENMRYIFHWDWGYLNIIGFMLDTLKNSFIYFLKSFEFFSVFWFFSSVIFWNFWIFSGQFLSVLIFLSSFFQFLFYIFQHIFKKFLPEPFPLFWVLFVSAILTKKH